MAGVLSAEETIFGAFVQEILSMPISFWLALYLVYPRYLFNMGPAYMFSRGVETLRIDGYLALVLLTHGELMSFHRLMKYGEPLSMGKTLSSIDTYSYKCAAGLKTLLVEYLLMQNRHMTGEEVLLLASHMSILHQEIFHQQRLQSRSTFIRVGRVQKSWKGWMETRRSNQ